MRNKVGLKTLAILLVIVIVASSVVVHSIGDMEKGIRESGGKGISSFVPPHFMGIASANSAECVAIIEENQTYEKAIVQRKQAELGAFQESQQGTPLSVMSFGDIVRTIPAPSADSCGLAWDGVNLWYVSWNYSNTSIHSVIYKVSSVDGTILGEWTSTVAADVLDMTWDGEYLYGVDFIDDKVYKFDPITLDIVGSIPAPSGIVGGLTWDGTYFWVTEGVTDLLYKVDSVGNVIQTYGGYGDLSMSGLAWGGENLWLELSFENCFLKINPNTGEVIETLSGGGNWFVFPGCAFDGQYLWCNWYDHNAVMSIAQIDIGERDTTEVKIGIM